MQVRPLVSIVTPVYNQERFVEDTIKSVLSQTYSPIEYIVINDGSTDGSLSVIEQYRDKVKIVDQINRGQAATLNRGWSESSGQFIGYLSSDDLLDPRCIERLVSILTANDEVVCAYPDCNLISPESAILKRGVCRPFVIDELVIEQECYIGPGALWRAAAHDQIGGWAPQLRLAPDREYWMRLSKLGQFYFLPEALAGYRLHPNSISYKEVSEAVSREYLTVLNDYFSAGDVPARIAARRSEAFANAYWLIARNMFRAGSYRIGLQYLRDAVRIDASILTASRIYLLARSTIGKPARILIAKLQRWKPRRTS